MNHSENTLLAGEAPIYDAVRDLDVDTLESTVRRNAAERHFKLDPEHMDVIWTLVEHYQRDCKTRDCLAAHEHMRYLEDAYAERGGSRYLYMLFDLLPDTRGVLAPIHELAGLPALPMDSDQGFGSSV